METRTPRRGSPQSGPEAVAIWKPVEMPETVDRMADIVASTRDGVGSRSCAARMALVMAAGSSSKDGEPTPAGSRMPTRDDSSGDPRGIMTSVMRAMSV